MAAGAAVVVPPPEPPHAAREPAITAVSANAKSLFFISLIPPLKMWLNVAMYHCSCSGRLIFLTGKAGHELLRII